jgi:hypothetical protein
LIEQLKTWLNSISFLTVNKKGSIVFRKLVSNLPFNPSLVGQVAFYTERVKKERAIRSLGMFFMIATLFLQMFAVIVPPEKSLAAGSNHILDGLSSGKTVQQNKNVVLKAWDENTGDVQKIYSFFGVSRDDIANMKNSRVTVNAFANDVWTIGRNSLSSRTGIDQKYKDSEIAIKYGELNTQVVYHRELRVWNQRDWYALEGTISKTGETFWILYDCGNFTKIKRWTPPPPQPIPAVCSIAGPIQLKNEEDTIMVPIRITLPAGASVPSGNTNDGLHLGISSKGDPSTWSGTSEQTLFQTPPDKQTVFTPQADGISGLTYYDFVWAVDNTTYRRYYVPTAKNTSFDVVAKVKVASTDKRMVVRLLDRKLGQWLAHNSACEADITKLPPPPPPPEVCEYNNSLPKGDPLCFEPCPYNPSIPTGEGCNPPPPPPPTPGLEIKKTIVDKPAFLKPGDMYTYLIQYRNNVNASLADTVKITDELDTSKFSIIEITPNIQNQATVSPNGVLTYTVGSLPFSAEYQEIRIKVRLNDQLASGSEVCNASRITASNAVQDEDGPICVGIIVPCPYDNGIPDSNNPNCTEPTLVCNVLTSNINRTTRRATFKTTASSSNPNGTTIKKYTYDYGDGNKDSFDTNSYSHETSHAFSSGSYTIEATVLYRIQNQSEAEDKKVSCKSTIDFEAENPVGKTKSLKNVTKDKTGQAALTTTVVSNDVLEYTLTTSNAQDFEKVGILVADYIGDVLDYGTLDMEFLTQQGGSYDQSTKTLSWKDIKIPANGEVKHFYRVKIKDPIPTTNKPSNITGDFDCRIVNEYGNRLTVNVNCPLVKGVESLPETGPGSSLAILGCITTIIGYFFARNRLLAKELDYVRSDFAATGGM